MDITELKSQIMHRDIKNFYIFTGEELGIIDIYVKQIAKVLNRPIIRAESVASIYSSCACNSLFGKSDRLYVIRDDTDFMKEDKVYATIEKDIGNNTIILLYSKIDSRLKFGKFFKDNIIKFEKLTPAVLSNYVRKSVELSPDRIEKLINICDCRYDLIMLEVDKIKQHAYNCNIDPDSSFDKLLSSGVIYQPEDTDVFKFVDAFCTKNVKEAIHILDLLENSGASSVNILGTLYNTLKSIMLIQAYGGGSGVCDVTGLDNRQVYFAQKKTGRFRLDELKTGVKLVAQVIDGIKSGTIDDKYATRFVVCRLL